MNCECHSVEFGVTTDLDVLLRHVMPYTPGLPHDMALDLVREAYKLFARRTGFLVHKCVIDSQANVRQYPLVVPEGYSVFTILGRKSLPASAWWFGDRPVFLTDFEVLDNTLIEFRHGYTKDEIGGIEVYVVLIPTDCCDTIPLSLEEPYGRGIAYGAIAEAMRLPNRPFTSLKLADLMELRFNRNNANAKAVAVRNRKVGGLMAKPVRIL